MPLGLKSGHARGPTPFGASPSFSYPGARHTPLTRLGRQHPAPGFRRASCCRYIFIAKNALFPTKIELLDEFFGCPTGTASSTLIFNFCRRRVVDVFWGASATPKDPRKSAHRSRVSDTAESLENAENTVNTVVFGFRAVTDISVAGAADAHDARLGGGHYRGFVSPWGSGGRASAASAGSGVGGRF